MDELITVIIPVYNVEMYINDCIESVIKQTYEKLEIILVNDGSTDNSGNICDMYQSIDNRVVVVHKKNGGLSDARNVGLAIAKGKYIVFIDSDDIIHEKYIELLYRPLIENNLDLMMCGYQRFHDANKVKKNMDKVEIKFIDNKSTLENILYQKEQNIFSVSAWGKLYKREVFNTINFPFGKLNEDLYIIVKVLNLCKNIGYIDNNLYFYRINPLSITQQKFNRKRLNVIDSCMEVKKDLRLLFPDIQNTGEVMLFSRAVEMLTIAMMTTDKDDFKPEKEYLIRLIKETRKNVIIEKKARKRTRIAAFLSFFNLQLVIEMLNVIRKRRYT